MNRFKKEIRARGVKLEQDYDFMPYPIKGKSCFEPGYISIQDIHVRADKAKVYTNLNIGCELCLMDRSGELSYYFL